MRCGCSWRVQESSRMLVPSTFTLLPRFLEQGDVLVVNTSGTIPAAIDATDESGAALVVHLSTQLDDNRWVVEPRRVVGRTTDRWVRSHADRAPSAGRRRDAFT